MDNVRQFKPKPSYTISEVTVYEVLRQIEGNEPVVMDYFYSRAMAEASVEFNKKEDKRVGDDDVT